MKFENLILEIDGRGVAALSLNRPDRHNAFNDEMIAELSEAFELLAGHKSVRAVILRGQGKSFCAGGDLHWMKKAAAYSKEENRADGMRLSDMYHALKSLPKPVIALAHGAVMGGGAGLIACADIAIASSDARFAFSEVRLGLIPATISPFVIAAIGERQARRYFLTGERFGADTARAIGLIHAVVHTPADLGPAAERMINLLLQAAPEAVAGAKALIAEVSNRPISKELRTMTAKVIAEVRAGDEAKEGLAAFFEKRKPGWCSSDE